jgi:hypothetical protein
MKMFSQLRGYSAARTLLCIITFMSVVLALAAADTNDIPKPYTNSNFVWGGVTNGLRAGVGWAEAVRNGSTFQLVQVFVVNSGTDGDWGYVKPPNERFAKFELLDSNGVIIVPRHGMELAGQLPQTIQSKDLPRTPRFGRNNPVLSGLLPLHQNVPFLFREFIIQDAYQIKSQGGYALTIWPAIYHFSTNKQAVARIDLPPVSVKIHLTSSP